MHTKSTNTKMCHTMKMTSIYYWKSVSVKCEANNVLICKKVIKAKGYRMWLLS